MKSIKIKSIIEYCWLTASPTFPWWSSCFVHELLHQVEESAQTSSPRSFCRILKNSMNWSTHNCTNIVLDLCLSLPYGLRSTFTPIPSNSALSLSVRPVAICDIFSRFNTFSRCCQVSWNPCCCRRNFQGNTLYSAPLQNECSEFFFAIRTVL